MVTTNTGIDVYSYAHAPTHAPMRPCVSFMPMCHRRVAHWPASQCGTEECVEAHTRVDVIVDVPGVRLCIR